MRASVRASSNALLFLGLWPHGNVKARRLPSHARAPLQWWRSPQVTSCEQVIGAPTLFATHFHELTGLKGDVGVANLHVETAIDQDSGKLTMLYQVTRWTSGIVTFWLSPCEK